MYYCIKTIFERVLCEICKNKAWGGVIYHLQTIIWQHSDSVCHLLALLEPLTKPKEILQDHVATFLEFSA